MRKIKLTKVEEALIYLASMCESPNHDQYKLRAHILDILGYEELKDKKV